MKLKRIDIVIIIILAILTIFTIDLIIFPEHQALVTNLWQQDTFKNISTGLTITFLVCLMGNLSPIPTPYTWVVCGGFTLVSANPFIPLLFAFVAALGALVGELAGYSVGRGAAEVISEERSERLKGYQEYLLDHPKLAPILIFLFGLTPLNDDLLLVPLGLIKYSVKNTIIWVWLGKLGMMTIMAYNVFGICGLLGGDNWIVTIVTLYVIVIMVYIMLKVNPTERIRRTIGNSSRK